MRIVPCVMHKAVDQKYQLGLFQWCWRYVNDTGKEFEKNELYLNWNMQATDQNQCQGQRARARARASARARLFTNPKIASEIT